MDKVIDTLCGGNKTLIELYKTSTPPEFRKKITSQDNIDRAVRVYITTCIREVVLHVIGILTRYMKPMGDMIIAGTDAFNMYLPDNLKIATTDIDTKFVPEFVIDRKLISSRSQRYFEYLQITKIVLWNFIGKLCPKIDKLIVRAMKTNQDTRFERVVGLSLSKLPMTSRRYTHIPKRRKNFTRATPNEDNVLVDIELFAIDMKMSYINIKNGKKESNPFNGILDIAFMRRNEFGWDVIKDKKYGIRYKHPVSGKSMQDKKMMIASPRFLLEDVHDIINLGIRKKKLEKDKVKFIKFVKHVVGIKSDSVDVKLLFKKAMQKLPASTKHDKRPQFDYHKYRKIALKYEPFSMENYTSQTTNGQAAMRKYFIGLNAPGGLNSKNFRRTGGNSRFNINSRKWVTNSNIRYIKNESKYRPTTTYEKKMIFKNKNIKPTLINYNPSRNYKMNKNLVHIATFIPLEGLRE